MLNLSGLEDFMTNDKKVEIFGTITANARSYYRITKSDKKYGEPNFTKLYINAYVEIGEYCSEQFKNYEKFGDKELILNGFKSWLVEHDLLIDKTEEKLTGFDKYINIEDVQKEKFHMYEYRKFLEMPKFIKFINEFEKTFKINDSALFELEPLDSVTNTLKFKDDFYKDSFQMKITRLPHSITKEYPYKFNDSKNKTNFLTALDKYFNMDNLTYDYDSMKKDLELKSIINNEVTISLINLFKFIEAHPNVYNTVKLMSNIHNNYFSEDKTSFEEITKGYTDINIAWIKDYLEDYIETNLKDVDYNNTDEPTQQLMERVKNVMNITEKYIEKHVPGFYDL